MSIALLFCLVVGVTDGDTLNARCGGPDKFEQITVQLSAIDAPELDQPQGDKARKALAELVYLKHVELRCQKTDRFRRHVCAVCVAPRSAPDGPRTLDVGLQMVDIGMAWWYRQYAYEQTPQERGQYEFSEQEARARKRGLWEQDRPTAPWNWRRRHSTAS